VKDDRVYLEHIRDALRDITTYTNTGRDAFFAERMRQDATLRTLEVIGQAVKNLSEETKAHQPKVPWKQIAGMRDKVIHDYFGVNRQTVNRECGFVRDHAVRVGPAHLRPQCSFHVLPEQRDRISCKAIHAAGHAFDVAALVELREPHLVQASLSRLGRGEVPCLLFGEFIQRGVPLATPHSSPSVVSIT